MEALEQIFNSEIITRNQVERNLFKETLQNSVITFSGAKWNTFVSYSKLHSKLRHKDRKVNEAFPGLLMPTRTAR